MKCNRNNDEPCDLEYRYVSKSGTRAYFCRTKSHQLWTYDTPEEQTTVYTYADGSSIMVISNKFGVTVEGEPNDPKR